MPDTEISSLLRIHDDLDELFALHQEALIERDWELAEGLFDAHSRCLNVHMAHEEELLLPHFMAAPKQRWPAKLYSGEHQKLLGLLDDAQRGLAALKAQTPIWRRQLLWLIDRESTFKNLVEHHNHAEAVDFFPVLDEQLAPDAKAVLLERCWSEYHTAYDAIAPLVRRARGKLSMPHTRTRG